MSVIVARLTSLRNEIATELGRFLVLWQYQHPVPQFALWWRLVVKRLGDILGAMAGMVVFLPAMAMIAAAIKLTSKGPVLYSQERVGRFGERFSMYKFRTMRVDAEANGPVWSAGDEDPRMTAVGKFLRRSHLDELPQFVNVLLGEMSLVGPRPERPQFVGELDEQIDGYTERLIVKPGMTGLAQVHYRYDQTIADVKRKLRFDLLYIRRMCLLLDARILAWTLLVVLTGKGIK